MKRNDIAYLIQLIEGWYAPLDDVPPPPPPVVAFLRELVIGLKELPPDDTQMEVTVLRNLITSAIQEMPGDWDDPDQTTCPECEHCAKRKLAREQDEFRVGDLCASRRRKWGRDYFEVTGVSENGHILGTIVGVGASAQDMAWYPQRHRQLGERTACRPDDIERRFTAEQWTALRAAGWPLSIIGTLRKARVPITPPPQSATTSAVRPTLGGVDDDGVLP